MNLKTIWKNNKLVAILLCGYFLLFIFLNKKQGITAMPVSLYGMFSAKQNITDTQSVYEFYINKEKINLSDYSFTERDIMLTSLNDYLYEKETNEAVYKSVNGVLNKVKINLPNEDGKYYNKINDTQFTNWYKATLQQIIKKEIDNIEIYSQKYIWVNGGLVKIDSAQKINEIVN